MLFITLGDPWSVTAECLAGLQQALQKRPYPVVFIGSFGQFEQQLAALRLALPVTQKSAADFDLAALKGGEKPFFLDIDPLLAFPTRVSAQHLTAAQRGEISIKPLQFLSDNRSLLNTRSAVLTCPITKAEARGEAFPFPGHTEFFAATWQKPTAMVLAGPQLKVSLVTGHMALRDVPTHLSAPLIVEKALLFASCLREHFQLAHPRVAVTSLNPHAGDHGLFGDEEARLIAPALELLQKEKGAASFHGPVPADTAFYRCLQGASDGVLCMYHDQALGPLKTVHFDSAVNITAGLPFLRISPDHGPARDLFLQGKASPQSFKTALGIADQLLQQRLQTP